MFDVGCLFDKENLEVISIFGACGIVSPGTTWKVGKSSVFDGKVCRAKDILSVNGYYSALANSLDFSMRVNSTAMGVSGYHCASKAISLSCSFFGRTVP